MNKPSPIPLQNVSFIELYISAMPRIINAISAYLKITKLLITFSILGQSRPKPFSEKIFRVVSLR